MTEAVSQSAPTAADANAEHKDHAPSFLALTVGSVGVVYGDIGTSPLYAFREAITAAAGSGPITREIVLGVLSLIVWSLIIVVTLKYIVILLRADNNGEGGTLSLTALAFRALGRRTPFVLMLGIVGAAMFYGSSFITPALSVMSAVEGLRIAAPWLHPFVLPITVVILVGLFAVQSQGTGRVSVFFGPITCAWFVTLALTGAYNVVSDFTVFHALNPYYAASFVASNGKIGLITLGAVFLVLTGCEALYADLGHFGRKPIQAAWFCLVLPALLINYFGQGALVLSNPAAIDEPFYRLVPEFLLLPLVAMATLATTIASQAVITGAYSLTQQAIQLGLLPRLEIRHTSATHYGQIYMPRVNAVLLIGVLLLVLMFRSSSNLAHAYVFAVAMATLVATPLGFIVMWKLWGWNVWSAAALMAPFMFVDILFTVATGAKLLEGAWVPVLFGAVTMLIMFTWMRGSRILGQKTRRTEIPLDKLIKSLERRPPHSVPGTAVFLTADPDFAPTAMLHNLKHNKVLHEHNVILTVKTTDTPRVPEDDRVRISQVSPRFSHVALRYGFMETPNVPKALAIARKLGWTFDIMSTSFFLSRRAIKPAAESGMPLWQDRLFIGLAKSSSDASDFFQIPTGRVVEIGTQVTV
jgi:KUP system potassium uptake protein